MSRYSNMEQLSRTLHDAGYFSRVTFPTYNEQDPKIRLQLLNDKESINVEVGAKFHYTFSASVSTPHMWVPLHLATEQCMLNTFSFNVPKIIFYRRLANLSVYALSAEKLQMSEEDPQFQAFSKMVRQKREAERASKGSTLLDILSALINPFD